MRVLVPGRSDIARSMPQGGGSNQVLGIGDKLYSVPLVREGRHENVPSYFYDTNRGNKSINDCVHSKLISVLGNPGYTQYYGFRGQRADCPTEFVSPKWTSSHGLSFRPCWSAMIGETRWHAVYGSLTRTPLGKYRVAEVGFNLFIWHHLTSNVWATMLIVGKSRWYVDDHTFGKVVVDTVQSSDYAELPYTPGETLGTFNLEEEYASRDAALEDIYSRLQGICVETLEVMSRDSSKPESGSSMLRVNLTLDSGSIPSSDRLRTDLSLNEVELTQEGLDPMQVPTIQYGRNWLVQHAYFDALQSAPRLNENSISNILEIVGFIKSLVVDHRIEIPKSLQSAWLSYRYQYSTSRLDAEEAIKFVHRNMDLGGLDKGIKCFGAATREINGKLVTCRCSLTLTPRELGILESVWRSLYTYGLQPNFYVLWDMIPYSFIVDWFIPLGDVASVLDAEAMFMRGENFDISNVCFSLSYDTKHSEYATHQYSRWRSQPLTQFNEFYWLDKPATSKRTLVYRILDTASLCIGR